MTKELFIETIEFIKKKRASEEKFCEVLEELSPDTYVNTFIYSDYETMLLKVLHDSLCLPERDDILEWWMYDQDFGTSKTSYIIENKKKIALKSAAQLYDYITKNCKK